MIQLLPKIRKFSEKRNEKQMNYQFFILSPSTANSADGDRFQCIRASRKCASRFSSSSACSRFSAVMER